MTATPTLEPTATPEQTATPEPTATTQASQPGAYEFGALAFAPGLMASKPLVPAQNGILALAVFRPILSLIQALQGDETPTPTITETPTPTMTPAPTTAPTSQPGGPVTIAYDYDPLGRLTGANYSNGLSYAYTYDAVGNRKTQTTTFNGSSSTVSYEYDAANRLTSMGGVDYQWDANGNLLSDGTSAYTYDAANRLISITQSPNHQIEYRYSGLGDRLQETTNGVTTTFTMDLNTGLTQALSDGTNTYLYGNGRIAQYDSTTAEYFLGDALGSVRQLTDASGAVTLAKAYDPYGVVTQTTGAGASSYGYTGEMTDSTGLVYLRARMYAPSMGRFMTRDTWDGDANRPLSFNRWGYVEGNPVNRVDPTGKCWIIEDGDGRWYPDSDYRCVLKQDQCELTKPMPPDHPYGGNEVMQFYLKLKEYKLGWWYTLDGKFDVLTFTGLMVIHEGGGDRGTREELTARAHAQQLYVGSNLPPYCHHLGMCSDNAVMNMWANYSASVRFLANLYVRQNNPISQYLGFGSRGLTEPTNQINRARTLGSLTLHPTTLDQRRYDALSDYGSEEYGWVQKIKKTEKFGSYRVYSDSNGQGLYTGFTPNITYSDPAVGQGIYYFTDETDGAVVFSSKNQTDYWKTVPLP